MKKTIYLDYAAATPLDPRVFAEMKPYFEKKYFNPSAVYLPGRAVKEDLNKAREIIAGWLGSRPSEIYFTAGATEANNLAISGIMQNFSKHEVLVSATEHDSVIVPAEQYNCNKIASTAGGIVDVSDIKKKISQKTVLVSVMYVNNELGTLQPLRDIAKLVHDERRKRLEKGIKTPIYLHTDAAQAGNFLDLHVSRIGVDLMSLNGGKIYGPKQTGALYVRAGIELKPLVLGGGQERGLRSGTENTAGFIGLSKALDIAQKNRESESKRLKELRGLFVEQIEKNIPEAVINGSAKHQAPHILHATFPGTDNERVMMELDERGIQCAAGSACSASSTEPSHVLSAIGMSDEDVRSSLRFSMGRGTAKKDVLKTVRILKSLTTK
jgi:cysteine desulfurase